MDLFRYILDETGNSDPRFLLYLVLFTAFAIFPVYLRILRHFVEVRSSVNIGTSDLKELRKELVSELKLQGATSIQKSSKVEIDLRNHQKSPSEQNFARLVENFIKQKTQTSISNWLDALTKSRETLENEIERLRSRSTTNLTIGLAITGISATVLVMALILPPKTIGEHSWMSIAEVYFPRAALVILLQISSAFFLRLHANNESDLKQNKNELINLDHKVAAVYLAIKRNDTSIIEEYLIKTERNFILEKGQTTAGRGSEIPIQSFIDAIREIPKPS